MAGSPWAHRVPPIRDTEGSIVGRWRPTTLAELTVSRLQLGAALHDGARPPATAEGAVQRLLLAFEELASNALRHGRLPIEVTVTQIGRSWLLKVSDGAADLPPAPVDDRDPAFGGMGLPLVAGICADQGWTVEEHRKVVWARVEHHREEEPGTPSGSGLPGPGAARRR